MRQKYFDTSQAGYRPRSTPAQAAGPGAGAGQADEAVVYVLHAAPETVRHRAAPGQLGGAQRQLEGLVPLGPLAELLVYLGVDRVAAEDDALGVVEPGVSAPVPQR